MCTCNLLTHKMNMCSHAHTHTHTRKHTYMHGARHRCRAVLRAVKPARRHLRAWRTGIGRHRVHPWNLLIGLHRPQPWRSKSLHPLHTAAAVPSGQALLWKSAQRRRLGHGRTGPGRCGLSDDGHARGGRLGPRRLAVDLPCVWIDVYVSICVCIEPPGVEPYICYCLQAPMQLDRHMSVRVLSRDSYSAIIEACRGRRP